MLIGILTALFTLSVYSGLQKGVKRLADWRLWATIAVWVFVLVVGPTHYLFDLFTTRSAPTCGTSWPCAPSPNLAPRASGFAAGPFFYCARWMSWARLVAVFIARISRGCTVPEFVLVVVVLPALFSFAFASALGGTALHVDLFHGGQIGSLVQSHPEVAPFETLHHLTGYGLLAALAYLLIVSFFVTSADSATWVTSSFSTRGSRTADVRLTAFWGLTLGGVAAVLVYAGSLRALQTASILGSFPFLFIMFLLVAATVRELWREARGSSSTPTP